MNFLFHCWLARSDEGLKAGGFLGDFIKGSLEDESYPADLKRGLKLHRHVDAVSNQLPSLRASYPRFGPELRRPAPVLLDLMADHLLAKHWQTYCEGRLTDFTRSCYAAISSYEVPATAQRLFNHAQDSDLFARYENLEVITDIMVRILKRLRFHDQLDRLNTCLQSEITGFEADFEHYFTDMEVMVASWLTSNTTA